jgi:hypothetical protein
MKIDNVDIFAGSTVVDTYLGMGVVSKIGSSGFTVSFEGNGSFDFLDGGYLAGQKRLGFTRKTYIEIPVEKIPLVEKILKALDITIKQGH